MEQQVKVIDFPRDCRKKSRKRDRLNAGRKGRVYSRGNKLWVDFYYLGKRVREPSGLDDTPVNRRTIRNKLDRIIVEIENGVFEFARRFPHSKKKDSFTLLEGKNLRKGPEELIFRDYVRTWWEEMQPGMSENQVRDYQCSLNNHLLPYFGDMPFSELKPVRIKKFLAHLKSRKNRYGEPLSGKSIRNYLIPLRAIIGDAIDEFSWSDLRDPFSGIKLPKVQRRRIRPFSCDEWSVLREHMLPWYRSYFEFAVQTGLRPSEQVALKWSAIDDRFVHIELSRVRNVEKADLKTEQSIRSIDLKPHMVKTLEDQWELTGHLGKPYVFLNTKGRPIQQENLGKRWQRALSESQLRYRRMYETRHTFASWALEAGESPQWVARTLGHVDASMVYRTYGRYIPNLTGKDGSAFERFYTEALKRKGNPNRHNCRHNRENSGCPSRISS
jgi:integrase